jgi:hypothetical protein
LAPPGFLLAKNPGWASEVNKPSQECIINKVGK